MSDTLLPSQPVQKSGIPSGVPFIISLFYCAGHGALALFEGNRSGVYLGLVLIAIGAGGIKPCVSAFVGDQFGEGHEKGLFTRIRILTFTPTTARLGLKREP